MGKILTYHDVLNLYYLDKNEQNLEVEFSTYNDIKNPKKLVFSNDMILSVRVENWNLRKLKDPIRSFDRFIKQRFSGRG